MTTLRASPLLRHFLAVVDAGSLTAAAARLSITQPALTKAIRKLEEELGVQLFERLPRGMAPTAYGRTLLPHARRIQAECRFADVEMQAFRGGRSGRLRVGAGPFFGAALVPGAVIEVQRRYPKLDVELDVGVNESTHPRLFDGGLDIVFCGLPAAGELPPFIERHPFFEIEARVIAGTRHPLMRRRSVPASALVDYPWAIYQEDREAIAHLYAAMREAGAKPPRIAVETTSLTMLIELLTDGPYLTCVADAMVAAQPDRGLAIVPYPQPIWKFPAGALLHRSLAHYAPLRLMHDAVRAAAGRLRLR
jgi:DNA-binding transcriptional LysR family regulator